MTKRVGALVNVWKTWNWRSQGDLMLNRAFFVSSGVEDRAGYARASSLGAKSSSMVGTITASAGALSCRIGSHC